MIEREDRDGIVVLRLAHGKVSAMDTELCRGLTETLDGLRGEAPTGVVVTGTGGIFSAGVDLFRIRDGGREYVDEFLPALVECLEGVLGFPRPLVAAVNGHAIAGGCVLACGCDHVYFAEGKARIGAPELLVGVPFPTVALEIVRLAASPATFRSTVQSGATFTGEEALRRGLVDEIVPGDQIVECAVERARTYGAVPRATWTLTRRMLAAPALERLNAARVAGVEREVHEIWASDETRAAVTAYLEKTLKK